MSKRFGATSLSTLMLLGVAVLCPTAARAQQMQMESPLYTYVHFWGVSRDRWGEMNKNTEEENKILQRLVADGTLVSWGATESVVHQEDGYTQSGWFQATSLANILKTLDTLRSSAQASVLVGAKHKDYLMRTLMHGGKTADLKGGYLQVGFYQTKPGADQEWMGLVRQYIKPGLDQMLADGSITMYNIDAEQIHTDAPGMHAVAIVVPDGTSLDKLAGFIPALMMKNPGIGLSLESLSVGEAHRDILERVIAYQHK